MPIKLRWLALGCLGVLTFVLLMPVLRELLRDPYAHMGTANFFVAGLDDESFEVIALTLGEVISDDRRPFPRDVSVPGGGRIRALRIGRLRAPTGLRQVELSYRLGREAEVHSFRFKVELVAQSACDVIVRFTDPDPMASTCINHMPGAYGGAWPH